MLLANRRISPTFFIESEGKSRKVKFFFVACEMKLVICQQNFLFQTVFMFFALSFISSALLEYMYKNQ